MAERSAEWLAGYDACVADNKFADERIHQMLEAVDEPTLAAMWKAARPSDPLPESAAIQAAGLHEHLRGC